MEHISNVKRTVILFTICTVFSSFPLGSNGEIPPKPTTSSVTILPPVKPADGPQAFPDAEKANLPVFTMDYSRIQIPFEITLWVLLASFAKIGKRTFVLSCEGNFRSSSEDHIAEMFQESVCSLSLRVLGAKPPWKQIKGCKNVSWYDSVIILPLWVCIWLTFPHKYCNPPPPKTKHTKNLG